MLTVQSGLEAVQTVTRVEWKSAIIMRGALCVMTLGVLLMQELCADSLDSQQQVHINANWFCEMCLLNQNE